ncbi:MAG: hypothetical protein U0X71_05775 [Sphingobacteriaceae bacterium]
MYLHFQKNSRTFEVRNTSEQSESTFLNQNKAQAACESQAYPSVIRRVSQRPEPILNQFKTMRNTKTIITSETLLGETSISEKFITENGLKITKTISESPSREIFIVVVPFTGTAIETVADIFEIATQYPDPDILEKTFYALANQQKLERAAVNN